MQNFVTLYWTLNLGCAIFVVASYLSDLNTIYPPRTRTNAGLFLAQVLLASMFLTWIALPLLVVAGVVRLTRKLTTGRWSNR